MMPPFPSAWILSLLVPSVAVFVILTGLAERLGRRPSPKVGWILLALCVIVLGLPWGNGSLARRLAGFVPGFSIPFTVYLLAEAARTLQLPTLLRPQDLPAFWWSGAATGLVLYPAALGWGPWDPYGWGWQFSPLFAATGLLGAGLIFRGQRLGWVLLVAIAAWQLRLLESPNYWDYLVDPLYFGLSLILLVWRKGGFVERHDRQRRRLADQSKAV
jgi:hypothetical protein